MATKLELISDIIFRVNQGNPSDDLQLSEEQVNHWLDTVRAELIKQALKEDQSMDGIGSYLTEKNGLSILKTKEKGREEYYVEIPEVISLPGEGGVYYVETQATECDEVGDEIHNVPSHQKGANRHLRFGKATKKNSAFSRIGNKLYLWGGSKNFYENGKINVILILADTTSLEDDDEYPIDSSLLPLLLEEVEQIARRQMFNSIEDEENDGKQQDVQ